MANLKFADTHNMVAFLSKPEESDGFEQIVDFLNAQPIKYALTVNPTIYTSCIEQFWSTVKAKTINREVPLHALVDEQQLDDMSTHKRIYIAPSHTKKIFGNIKRACKGFSGRVTPLFPIMVVQNQQELGEGSAIPTDPHHTPTITQPSTSQPQKTQKPRKPKRKDTQVPQPSGPTDIVADEAVHKELGDNLVRAATTASSLEAEQDNGETIAQTRFENVSKHSNDSLLARGNTLQSNEDSLKLTKLMEICTNLQQRVLNLEKTKTTQQNEIASLKKRVKKLEQKKRLRTHGMKRLHKVGMSRRVVSSGDEEDLGEDASKQGRRINVIDVDEDITLVSVQDDAGAELFDVVNSIKKGRLQRVPRFFAEMEKATAIDPVECVDDTWRDINVKRDREDLKLRGNSLHNSSNTLAEYMILFGADNRPSMLDKDLYDSWKSRMELYMQNREHGRMILESVKHGPLIWPTVEENGVIRTKKYAELSAAEKIQADCDMKATNIILQGLPGDIYSLVNHHRVAKDLWERVQLLMQGTSLTKQERECKLYDAFDKFTHIKEESLHTYYLRFTQLINDMNIYKMKTEQFQVNTKFLNSLPPEWSKFVTGVKLVKDL
ncbi:hypothetical protein Tco_0304959, partial [Tanacetum coccineum]